MSDAIEMRVANGRYGRRLVASILGVSVLLCVVLGARHEAKVGHWRDRTGQLRHAVAVSATAVSDRPSVHRGSTAPDLEPCELAAARHAPASASVTAPWLATRIHVALVTITSAATNVVETTAVYRLAPKTSPPTA